MLLCLLDLSFSCGRELFLLVFCPLEKATAPPVSPGPHDLSGTDTGVSVSHK